MRYPSFDMALSRFQKNISHLSVGKQRVLWRAYYIAKKAHCGQKKFGLYPYIIHPLSVFNFLFEKLHIRDYHLLVASLLHDVAEDSGVALDVIRKKFGLETYDIVKTVTRIPKARETEADKKTLKMRHFRKIVCKGNWEAKILGIADKYDNVRRMPLIPQSNPHRKKFPRWINEAENFLKLAKRTDTNAYHALEKALRKLKTITGRKENEWMNEWLLNKIRKENMPVLILICGMPGTRKSSTAVKLGAALNFATVVGMDEIRDVMRIYDKRPIIQGRSHNRWKLFGSPAERNFIKGFLGHCRTLKKGAMAILRKNMKIGENTIIEGVHLVPSLYRNIPKVKVFRVMLTAKDHIHHKELLNEKFDRRHGIQKKWLSEKVWHIEQIQDFLLRDAQKNNITVFTSTTPEENCDKIIAYLKKQF